MDVLMSRPFSGEVCPWQEFSAQVVLKTWPCSVLSVGEIVEQGVGVPSPPPPPLQPARLATTETTARVRRRVFWRQFIEVMSPSSFQDSCPSDAGGILQSRRCFPRRFLTA